MLILFTQVMKWVSVMVLLVAALWRSLAIDQVGLLVLQFVVCAGALLVAWQAGRRSKHLWTAGFIAIALLFNPVAPIVLSRMLFLGLDFASLAAFLVSIAVLKRQPALSRISITSQAQVSGTR